MKTMNPDVDLPAGPWKIDERLAWQVVGDEAVLLDLGAGRAIGLNATGSFIWPLIESTDQDGLVRAVVERFQVDAESARDGIIQFFRVLRDRGLIATAEPGAESRMPPSGTTKGPRGDDR